MRTTLAINDAILEAARREALLRHVSLAKFIETAVREKLAEDVREKPEPYRAIVTFKGDGLRPGIELKDSNSLLDTMGDA